MNLNINMNINMTKVVVLKHYNQRQRKIQTDKAYEVNLCSTQHNNLQGILQGEKNTVLWWKACVCICVRVCCMFLCVSHIVPYNNNFTKL